MLGYCSSWGVLIFYDSSLVILSLVFHPSFKQSCPLGSSYLVGKVLSICLWNSLSLTMIPFLIYILCFLVGVTFPLVALDKVFF